MADLKEFSGRLRAWVGDEMIPDVSNTVGVDALAQAIRENPGVQVRRESVVLSDKFIRKPVTFALEALQGMADTGPTTHIDWEHDSYYSVNSDIQRQGVTDESELMLFNGNHVIVDTQRITGERALSDMADGVVLGNSVEWDVTEKTKKLCSRCGEDMTDLASPCVHWPGMNVEGETVRVVVSHAIRNATALTARPASDSTKRLSMAGQRKLNSLELEVLTAHAERMERRKQQTVEDPMAEKTTPVETPKAAPAVDVTLTAQVNELSASNDRLLAELQLLKATAISEKSADIVRLARLSNRVKGDEATIIACRNKNPELFDELLSFVPEGAPINRLSTGAAGAAPELEGIASPAELADKAKALAAESGRSVLDCWTELRNAEINKPIED
jgi:hypothetical protein